MKKSIGLMNLQNIERREFSKEEMCSIRGGQIDPRTCQCLCNADIKTECASNDSKDAAKQVA